MAQFEGFQARITVGSSNYICTVILFALSHNYIQSFSLATQTEPVWDKGIHDIA